MSKNKISKEEFVDFLIDMRNRAEKEIIEILHNDTFFRCEGDEKKFLHEVEIFALWLVTISAPPSNVEILDMFHNKFYDLLNLDEETRNSYDEEIDKRYKNYYDAYNVWQANPKSGHIMGSAIVETIVNQNPNFSLKNEIPMVGDLEAMHATILFVEVHKVIMESVEVLKKRFSLDEIIKD